MVVAWWIVAFLCNVTFCILTYWHCHLLLEAEVKVNAFMDCARAVKKKRNHLKHFCMTKMVILYVITWGKVMHFIFGGCFSTFHINIM